MSAIILFVAGFCLFSYWLYRGCFEENRHFEITEDNVLVELINTDFFGSAPLVAKKSVRSEVWESIVASVDDKQNKMNTFSPLTVYKVNLFTIDWKKLLNHIERSPSVKKASVKVSLPDRLTVRINARMPIAFLESGDGRLVCDQDGKVMERDKLLIPKDTLPILRGSKKRNFRVGDRLGEMEPALQLLTLLSRNADQGLRPLVVKVVATELSVELRLLCSYRPNPVSEERTYLVELLADDKLPAKVRELVAQLREYQVAPLPTKINYIRLLFNKQIISGYLPENQMKSMISPD